MKRVLDNILCAFSLKVKVKECILLPPKLDVKQLQTLQEHRSHDVKSIGQNFV